MYSQSRILISGGTGSWGKELTKQLLTRNPKEILIYSRNEYNQVLMQREYNNPKLKFILGDVRDFERLNFACQEVDYIFHLAAYKHVPLAEDSPSEFIKTNINGTENVIKAALANRVKKVVDVSSDKACEPSSVYGATKFIAERMILRANELGTKTDFQCIRGGNVLGSAGSIVPLFISQIKNQNKVTITDARMTRYFMTLPEAISLLFMAMESKVLSATYIMSMKTCSILDMAKVLIKHYGNKNTKLVYTGIRPGEKLHELLISKTEALNAYVYNKNYYIIYPSCITGVKYPKVEFQEYNSSYKPMNEKEIETMLRKGGFLQ